MAVEARPSVALGDRIPDLALPTIDGGELRLRDLEGRRVLLFCWASW